MGKHTPTPWKRDNFVIRVSRGVIARIPRPQDGGVFECDANAAFIVTAANAHYDLVKALQEAVPWLKHAAQSASSVEQSTLRKIFARADAGLAAAHPQPKEPGQ